METVIQLSKETGIHKEKVMAFFRTAHYSNLVMKKTIDYKNYNDLKKVLVAYYR